MEQRLTVYLLDLQINAFSDNILTGLLVLKGVTKMGSGSSGLYLGTYGSSLSSGISSEDIKPFHIGVSLGAKAMNYDIKDKRTGKIYHFAEGSDISHIEVFAGKGTRNKLSPKVVHGLSKEYGVGTRGWQHAKGLGTIQLSNGKRTTAEVHWFQHKDVGRVEFKIKEWL